MSDMFGNPLYRSNVNVIVDTPVVFGHYVVIIFY